MVQRQHFDTYSASLRERSREGHGRHQRRIVNLAVVSRSQTSFHHVILSRKNGTNSEEQDGDSVSYPSMERPG